MEATLTLMRERYLSAQDYLREAQKNATHNNIETVQFIPPTIGKPGYGQFRIRYKTPVLIEE